MLRKRVKTTLRKKGCVGLVHSRKLEHTLPCSNNNQSELTCCDVHGNLQPH